MENEKATLFREHEIEWDEEKVARLWDYYSRTPPYSDVYFSKVFGQQILQHSGLPLKKQLKVLDFGCGPGFIWDHLIMMGACWEYTALDFSYDSIAKVIKKAKGHDAFKGAQHVRSLPVNLSGAYFDAVLLLEVVEHLNDNNLNEIIGELNRLVKQDGVVVITVPNEENLAKSKKFCPECGAVFHDWQHIRSWSVGSLTAYMEQQGFMLRMAKTLDFNAHCRSIRGALRKMKGIVQQIFKCDPYKPHLIAVFQKK